MSSTLRKTKEPLVSDSPDDARYARNLALSSHSPRPWNAWLFRCCLAGIAAAIAFSLSPFALHGWRAASVGVVLTIIILVVENRLKRSSASGLLGGAIGGILGALRSEER